MAAAEFRPAAEPARPIPPRTWEPSHPISDAYGFTLTNVSSGLVLGIAGQSQVAGTALAQETNAGSATTDDMWHAMPMGSTQEQYNLENLLTHQLMGISAASTATGAVALQYADNGTNDHLWQFYLLTDGNYLIKNVNSGYYLEDENSGTSSTAVIDQNARATIGAGCACQEWKLTLSTTPAYPAPRTVNGTGIFVHDPYMLKDPNGTYWLYGTHQTLAYSTDLTTFTYTTMTSAQGACTSTQGGGWLTVDHYCPIIGPDFASWSGLQTPPTENNGANNDIWAPSMLVSNGTYYLYYSVPYEPSTGAEAVIGLATSSSPSGPWADKGYVVSSWTSATTPPPSNSAWNFNSATTWNAIDPDPFIDANGNWWMSFGSFSDGIHLLQLNPFHRTRPVPGPVDLSHHCGPRRRRRGLVYLPLCLQRHAVLLLLRAHQRLLQRHQRVPHHRWPLHQPAGALRRSRRFEPHGRRRHALA